MIIRKAQQTTLTSATTGIGAALGAYLWRGIGCTVSRYAAVCASRSASSLSSFIDSAS